MEDLVIKAAGEKALTLRHREINRNCIVRKLYVNIFTVTLQWLKKNKLMFNF